MFTQVTVYFKKCFMEIDSGCLRDEASRGLTYKRLNPKCYTQGGLHHQTHAHYGLDRRRQHWLFPLYHHPHPSPSSHCITSHHSMVSFFHKVSHCVGFTLARLEKDWRKKSCFPTSNIANVFQVFRAWAKLAMEYLQYVAFIYAMNLYMHIISTSHANLRNIYIIIYQKYFYIHITPMYACILFISYHLSFGLCL